MRRETVNRIRFVLEELLPPILRDSRMMRWLFRLHWGEYIDVLERFRADIAFVDEETYAAIYAGLPPVHEAGDNSSACLAEIAARASGGRICDVGCGHGRVLGMLSDQPHLHGSELHGVDFRIAEAIEARFREIRFTQAKIESLPFPDGHFDTVIATHILEHILDIEAAISELRRISSDKLIIVVPREREYAFTFNPHIHFFPYLHSFIRTIRPKNRNFVCFDIGRDIFYMECKISKANSK